MRWRGRRQIYTRVARILISLNPFQQLPIYDQESLLRYSGDTDARPLPHPRCIVRPRGCLSTSVVTHRFRWALLRRTAPDPRMQRFLQWCLLASFSMEQPPEGLLFGAGQEGCPNIGRRSDAARAPLGRRSSIGWGARSCAAGSPLARRLHFRELRAVPRDLRRSKLAHSGSIPGPLLKLSRISESQFTGQRGGGYSGERCSSRTAQCPVYPEEQEGVLDGRRARTPGSDVQGGGALKYTSRAAGCPLERAHVVLPQGPEALAQPSTWHCHCRAPDAGCGRSVPPP